MALEIESFICRSDNYAVLLHDTESGQTASIDAPEAAAIESALDRRGWTLTHILCTHHHADHTDGNAALMDRHGAELVAPAGEAQRIARIDRTVRGGDAIEVCGRRVEVIDTPGHTSGHIAYHIPSEDWLFAADCLFSLGCGRVFEGTHEEMHASLERLAALPGATRLHCGHEYTASNARFALSVDPDNETLRERAEEVERLRADDRPTLPVTLERELRTNPFLRCDDEGIADRLGLRGAAPAEVFAELRRRKDAF